MAKRPTTSDRRNRYFDYNCHRATSEHGTTVGYVASPHGTVGVFWATNSDEWSRKNNYHANTVYLSFCHNGAHHEREYRSDTVTWTGIVRLARRFAKEVAS